MMKQYIQIFFFLMTSFIASAPVITTCAQETYKGGHAEFFQKKAFSNLQNFYRLLIEVSFEDELFALYQQNITANYLGTQPFLKPDFIHGGIDDGVYSFEKYLSAFQRAYGSYFCKAMTNPDALIFKLSSPRSIFTRYTTDMKGLLISLEFNVQLSSMDKPLYEGKSQAVVEFKDMLNLTECRINQIIPIQTLESADIIESLTEDNSTNSTNINKLKIVSEAESAVIGSK